MGVKRRRVAWAVALLLCLSLGLARAVALEPPHGPVILTVAGAVTETNRGPFDARVDEFFAYHDLTFEKAAAFDAASLEALGMQDVVVRYADRQETDRFAGPRLRDVLDAAGAVGSGIRILALDGYVRELSRADIDAYDWIVALKRNGEALGIGQFGPLWVVYARHDGQSITAEDEARWPWAVFYIQAE
jgi:hypothetical protein